MFSLSNNALNSVCFIAFTESVGRHCQKSDATSASCHALSSGNPSISILSSVILKIFKTFFEKFKDNNFIKNNNKGYYIWKKKREILLLEIYFLQNIKKE